MSTCRRGRFAPAFILLFLTEGPSYGTQLLRQIAAALPENRMDNAVIYRSLQHLEAEGSVVSTLDDSQSGPVRKYYHITPKGEDSLKDFNDEIQRMLDNLSVFQDKYMKFQTGR